MYKFLIINPGSTSTKISIYENDQEVISKNISHPSEKIHEFPTIYSQLSFRLEHVKHAISEFEVDLATFSAIAARGGNMKPVCGGTYKVNQEMLEDLKIGVMGQHASNIGGWLAHEIAKDYGLDAYIVDPVIVDEFEPLARYSGTPLIKRKSKDHPLNQKAVARAAAADLNGKYQDFNFLVAHMGGGVSVGIHKKGRIIDVNNCLNGDGPMSPERCGGIPFGSLMEICYEQKYSFEELRKQLIGKGGLVGYLGTNDAREVLKRIAQGDKKAEEVYQAMAYQISKEIGAGATVLEGQVDAILLTGGLAYDDLLTGWIEKRVGFIAPVKKYPGEHEMKALAQGVMRVLEGVEEAQKYPNEIQIPY